jgi:hypothetical protein
MMVSEPLDSVSGESGLQLMEKARAQNAWGIASAIDIYNCSPEKIRDSTEIKRFVFEL